MEWVCGLSVVVMMGLWFAYGTGLVKRPWVIAVVIAGFIVASTFIFFGQRECFEQPCPEGQARVYQPNRTVSCTCE